METKVVVGMGARVGLVAAVLGMALAGPASAEKIALKAAMSGANESPANDSKATGNTEASYDTETRMLEWTVTFSGLTGPAIGAHIHGPAATGANAGIMIPFTTLESPIKGSAKLTEEHAAQLLQGRMYVNIHTRAHPGGEIRGQLAK